jgi:predicted ATP-grasp superfamily ATP-dependent carboligase
MARGLKELRARYRSAASIVGHEEIIVQELIPGGGSQQYSYCCLFVEGTAVASMTVRRLRQHPSDFGRASTYVETIDLPELEALSVRFLDAIGYRGLVELEYKYDPGDGAYKLLDVNARTWGYHSLGAAAGVDFPFLLWRDRLGLRCLRPTSGGPMDPPGHRCPQRGA